jgi:hypothetical protein
MPDEMSEFDKGLGKMGAGIRRAKAGFAEADEGFRKADEGFIEALNALKVITIERGSLDERFKDMQESIARLEALVLTQSAELREQNIAFQAQGVELRALRERIDQLPPI